MSRLFHIPLPPRPQLRARATRRGKHAVVYDDPKSKADKEAFAAAIPDGELLEGPLRVLLLFVMPIPKSVKAEARDPHIKKPDIDNLIKLALDAMTQSGKVWEDDNQVCELVVRKEYGETPMTLVGVEPVSKISIVGRILRRAFFEFFTGQRNG